MGFGNGWSVGVSGGFTTENLYPSYSHSKSAVIGLYCEKYSIQANIGTTGDSFAGASGRFGRGCGDECFQLATVRMTPCASFPSVISLAVCAPFGTSPLSDEVVVCEMNENLPLLHLHFDFGNKPGGVYSQYLTVKFGVFHNA